MFIFLEDLRLRRGKKCYSYKGKMYLRIEVRDREIRF